MGLEGEQLFYLGCQDLVHSFMLQAFFSTSHSPMTIHHHGYRFLFYSNCPCIIVSSYLHIHKESLCTFEQRANGGGGENGQYPAVKHT